MSNEVSTSPMESIPSKHIAILFEGSWFMVQDPSYDDRLLAYCPYVKAPDHKCEFGFWSGSDLDVLGHLAEGQHYVVNVKTDKRGPDSVKDVLRNAHLNYHFPYFTSKSATLSLTDTSGMRCVSISKPKALLADGQLTNAEVHPGRVQLGDISGTQTGKLNSYVTFIFIYQYDKPATISMGLEGQKQISSTTDHRRNPHLIFRVHGLGSDSDKCGMDCAADHVHLMKSFDAVRKVVYVESTTASASTNSHCNVAIYPAHGELLKFDNAIKGFSRKELGLPVKEEKDLANERYLNDFAACAGGPAGGNWP